MLSCKFYSPLTNFHSDEYGPHSIANRTRFLVRVIRAVRKAVGDFPISVRFGGADYMPGGSTVEDAAEAARILAREDIDLLSLSGGLCIFQRRGHSEPGFFADMAEAVKGAVDTPVLLTGGIRRPGEAEHFLAAGTADPATRWTRQASPTA